MAKSIPATIVAQVVEAGCEIRVDDDGKLQVRGPMPHTLRADLRRHRTEVVTWFTVNGSGQDAVGLFRMARARQVAGVPLSPEDTAVLDIVGGSTLLSKDVREYEEAMRREMAAYREAMASGAGPEDREKTFVCTDPNCTNHHGAGTPDPRLRRPMTDEEHDAVVGGIRARAEEDRIKWQATRGRKGG